MKPIIKWLGLPEVKNLDTRDEYQCSLLHATIIQKKTFLKKIYTDFYARFKESIPSASGAKLLVELGSGGGFIKDIIPDVVTSDILPLPHVDKHFSALHMPFGNETVDAFFMIDVLHHIDDARVFFQELHRCLKPGGKAMMIEPANTAWSRFIFRYFHHEPFDCTKGWVIPKGSPLFSSNSALPWIIFYRDRDRFEKEFCSFKIVRLEPHTPFRYLVSGGLSGRQLLPTCMYAAVKATETMVSPLNKYLGMFLTIEIKKRKL